ncbi:hypothetical protein [Halomarina rubra]|uniref:Ig-like domain-containing protein n=1 Tax=Halomarina rubra TaxID=2071873 RepID=A0ABD6AXX9_9EURY|nr:hypothetical protein [Halomarina rubra]
MNRRALLAAVGTSLLAGCSGRDERSTLDFTPATEPPPPENVTTITETKPVPTPADVTSREAARSFVETHEQRYVYNELVGGGMVDRQRAATSVDVEPAEVAVVAAVDGGYYLLSTCRGTAEYYSPGSSSRGGGRTAGSVAHYVDASTHRRIPFNFFSCESFATPATPGEAESLPARLQVYDFDTPPDYDRPDQGGHRVDVTVGAADGNAVLDTEVRTSLPLTVLPGVTETPGTYQLSASLPDADSVTYEWSPSPDDPSWWATAVVVTNDGGLEALQLHPNEAVGLPRQSSCERRR